MCVLIWVATRPRHAEEAEQTLPTMHVAEAALRSGRLAHQRESERPLSRRRVSAPLPGSKRSSQVAYGVQGFYGRDDLQRAT